MPEKLGHNIIKLEPALVPMVVKDGKTKELQGLSLRNIEINIKENNKKVSTRNLEKLILLYLEFQGLLY
ncbi:putative flavoprotein YhiN [Clostridium butyricum]|nr:putative flavoprotein YhiN [Clostridium butyricum]